MLDFILIKGVKGPDGVYHFDPSMFEEKDSSGDMIPAIIILILVASPVIYWSVKYMYSRRNNHFWEDGIFPPNLSFNKKNLMEAYICLAARMIQGNVEDAREKQLYMNRYFQKHFPKAHYDFSESLVYSYRNPIKLHSVAQWLNKRVQNREERIQVMNFLAAVAMIDGDMNATEMAILQKMSYLLKLSSEEYESIISTYRARQQRQQETQSSTSSYSRESILATCYQVLGIPDKSPIAVVKKAYRKLAMTYHPDKYVNHTSQQKEHAENRFLEIQKAYETIEKYS